MLLLGMTVFPYLKASASDTAFFCCQPWEMSGDGFCSCVLANHVVPDFSTGVWGVEKQMEDIFFCTVAFQTNKVKKNIYIYFKKGSRFQVGLLFWLQ